MDLEKVLRHVPDFPKKGIDFIDITTVLQDSVAFRAAIDRMVELVSSVDYDVVIRRRIARIYHWRAAGLCHRTWLRADPQAGKTAFPNCFDEL